MIVYRLKNTDNKASSIKVNAKVKKTVLNAKS